jgi:acyl carrier protein
MYHRIMPLTRENLLAFLQGRFGISAGSLGAGIGLLSEGLIDSFGLVELLAFIEKAGGLRIPARDVTLDNLDSVERIMSYLGRRQS